MYYCDRKFQNLNRLDFEFDYPVTIEYEYYTIGQL